MSVDFTQTAPPPERTEGALGPYLRAIRAHRLLIALVTLAALAGSIAWLSLRSPDYEATSQLLVTPLPPEDETFRGLQVIRQDTNESTRTLQTAATLVEAPEAAALTARRIGNGFSSARVQAAVQVEPQGESNILSVTATAENARLSARLANEYTRAALDTRKATLRRQIDALLSQLNTRFAAVGDNRRAQADISEQINRLETVRSGGDPTLSLSQRASVPTEPVGAPSWIILVLAALAGFTLGTGAAVLIELLDRRVRDEEELGMLYPLPVLTHVPLLGRRLGRSPDTSPKSAPPGVREAFRTLQVQLDTGAGGLPRTVMFTSATTGDGKTTSAANFAFALVGAGHRVILMDFDLRKPDIGNTLGVQPKRGLVSLLASDAKLSDLLVQTPELPPLRVVPAGAEGDVVLLEALSRRLPDILAEARSLADYVVIDTAPLGEVSDALRLAALVDDIIVVARPGNTNRANFELMRDLLDRTGRTPTGMLVMGDARGRSNSYYAYGLAREQSSKRPSLARSASR